MFQAISRDVASATFRILLAFPVHVFDCLWWKVKNLLTCDPKTCNAAHLQRRFLNSDKWWYFEGIIIKHWKSIWSSASMSSSDDDERNLNRYCSVQDLTKHFNKGSTVCNEICSLTCFFLNLTFQRLIKWKFTKGWKLKLIKTEFKYYCFWLEKLVSRP